MDVTIPVSAKRCAVALSLIVAVLVAGSLGASSLSFVAIDDPFLGEVRESVVRLAWVDEEGNIPAWYSASLLLLCSLLLAAIACAQRQRRDRNVVYWLVLSLIFAFLSLDETAQLHELSIRPLQDMFGATGFLHYAWIIPAGLCVVLFVLAYLSFLAKLPARTRRLFLVAGAAFVGGAIGVEAISGKHASLHGEDNLTYHLIITLEELFEMSGLVLFIYALLDYISRQFTKVSFQVASR
jgi:hypothetical protein